MHYTEDNERMKAEEYGNYLITELRGVRPTVFLCTLEVSAMQFVYVVIEVRMRTLDQFFEIEILTYSDITSLLLSLYHVLERKTLLRQSYRA